MKEEAGGAAGRRGYNFQDLAAAYFFLSDEPDFISQQPLELHIEGFDSDFAYFIRLDEYDIEHFFEVKYRQTGDYKLSQFYRTLSDFSDMANNQADPDNRTIYHFVSNASFGPRLKSLFDDAGKLRRGIRDWTQIKDKTIYQVHNINQLEENTDLDDIPLPLLVQGLYGHRKTGDEMVKGLHAFIRKCNSPGEFRKPTETILRIVGEKDSGIIRRETLEEESGASLTSLSSSTDASHQKTTAELAGELESMADEFASPSIDTSDLYEKREATIEFTERMLEREESLERAVETQGASLQEDIDRLIDVKEQEEQLKYGISKKAERFVGLDEPDSTDNEASEEDI